MLSENGWFVFNFWGEGGGGVGIMQLEIKLKYFSLLAFSQIDHYRNFAKIL